MPASAALYWRYWGKTLRTGEAYHLLPFHSLDVAAVFSGLLEKQPARLKAMADDLGLSSEHLLQLLTFLTALHDLGKFSRAFQGLVHGDFPDLVPYDARKAYSQRHDTLGYWLWCKSLASRCSALPSGLAAPDEVWPPSGESGWFGWLAVVCGHHGQPPRDLAEVTSNRLLTWFCPEDIEAAASFANDMAHLLLPPIPALPRLQLEYFIQRHGWYLAGLVVLADWVGSNAFNFPYLQQPIPLEKYWDQTKKQAASALLASGVLPQACASYCGIDALFDYLQPPTPLQQFAHDVPLATGPQLFILEDVTGAGKTEAALILVARLMSAGRADGVYFALPSMATANQMYRRVGQVYRKLFVASAQPSLVLAHSARKLVDAFTDSVLPSPELELNYQPQEEAASVACSAWLADSRKKTLLAQVGVGTLDQALLAVLPARHQSLRLFGLASKVLVVDEVHAYDAYMHRLLCTLLTVHASLGGSVLLLSATLPAGMRADLCRAFRKGCGLAPQVIEPNQHYPLATHVNQQTETYALPTRAQLQRRIAVEWLYSEEAVIECIVQAAQAGQCVCWVRNTVGDALTAYQRLSERLPDAPMLFHSRFAMGDRLQIETQALDRFGTQSDASQRRGRVLVATQVVEQSLDLDFDCMVSDWAPIDLIIQRAGRLHRHRRDATGRCYQQAVGTDQRRAPVLHLFAPAPNDAPGHNWYADTFPKAQYVYPHHGQLWLGWQALSRAGAIVTPGDVGEVGSVRQLVEAVYGAEAQLPEGLQQRENQADGKDGMGSSMAAFNALKFELGYSRESHSHWDEEVRVATRLADESVDLYLVRVEGESLLPWWSQDHHAWPLSCVRLRPGQISGLAPAWQQRFGVALNTLRQQTPLLDEPAIILPLERVGSSWRGQILDGKKQLRLLEYHPQRGVDIIANAEQSPADAGN